MLFGREIIGMGCFGKMGLPRSGHDARFNSAVTTLFQENVILRVAFRVSSGWKRNVRTHIPTVSDQLPEPIPRKNPIATVVIN